MYTSVDGRPVVRVAYVNRGFDAQRAITQGQSLDYGWTFIWPGKHPPTLGTLTRDHRGAQVCIVGYGSEYDGPALAVLAARGHVSAAKVTAAILTCGASLIVTRGVRSRL